MKKIVVVKENIFVMMSKNVSLFLQGIKFWKMEN